MPRFTRREFIKAAGGFVSAATLGPSLLSRSDAADPILDRLPKA